MMNSLSAERTRTPWPEPCIIHSLFLASTETPVSRVTPGEMGDFLASLARFMFKGIQSTE